jgi:hypothetical protein
MGGPKKSKHVDNVQIDPQKQERDQRFDNMLYQYDTSTEHTSGENANLSQFPGPYEIGQPERYLFNADVSLIKLSEDTGFTTSDIWTLNPWYFSVHTDFIIRQGDSLLLPGTPSVLPVYMKPGDGTNIPEVNTSTSTTVTTVGPYLSPQNETESVGTKDIVSSNVQGNVYTVTGSSEVVSEGTNVVTNTQQPDPLLLKLQEEERLEQENNQKQRDLQKTINPAAKLSPEMKAAVNWDATLALFRKVNRVDSNELHEYELVKWTKICLRDGWLPSDPIPNARDVKELAPKDGYNVYSSCNFDLTFAYGRKTHLGVKFYWYYNINEVIQSGPSGTSLAPAELWANVELIGARTVDYALLKEYAGPDNLTLYNEVMKISPNGVNIKERYKSQQFYDLVKAAQRNVYTNPKDAGKIDGHYTVQFDLDLKNAKQTAVAAKQKEVDEALNGKVVGVGTKEYVREGRKLVIIESIMKEIKDAIDSNDINKALEALKQPGVLNRSEYIFFLDDRSTTTTYRTRLLDMFINQEGYTGYDAESEYVLAQVVYHTQKAQRPKIKPYLNANNDDKFKKLKALINNDVFAAKRVFLIGAETIMDMTNVGEITKLKDTAPAEQAAYVIGLSDKELATLEWTDRETIMNNIVENFGGSFWGGPLDVLYDFPQAITMLLWTTPAGQKEQMRVKIFDTTFQKTVTDRMSAEQRIQLYDILAKMYPDQVNTAKTEQIQTADSEESAILASELTPAELHALTFEERFKLLLSSSSDSAYMLGSDYTEYGMQGILNLLTTTSREPNYEEFYSPGSTATSGLALFHLSMEGDARPVRSSPQRTVTTQMPSDRDQMCDALLMTDGYLLSKFYDDFYGSYLIKLRDAIGNLYNDNPSSGMNAIWGTGTTGTSSSASGAPKQQDLIDFVMRKVDAEDSTSYKFAWYLSPAMMDTMNEQDLFDIVKVISRSTVGMNTNATGNDSTVPTIINDIYTSIGKEPQKLPNEKDEDYELRRTQAANRRSTFATLLNSNPAVLTQSFMTGISLTDDSKAYSMKKALYDIYYPPFVQGSIAPSQKSSTTDDLVSYLSFMSDERMSAITINDRLHYVDRISKMTTVFDEKENIIIGLFRSTPNKDTRTSSIILMPNAMAPKTIDELTMNTKGTYKSDIDTMLDSLSMNMGTLYNQIHSALDFAEFPMFHETIKNMGFLRLAQGTAANATDQTMYEQFGIISEAEKTGQHTGGAGTSNIFLYANPGFFRQATGENPYVLNVYWEKDKTGKEMVAVESYVKPPMVEFAWLLGANGIIFDQGTPVKEKQLFDPFAMVGVQHLLDETGGITKGTVEFMMAINLFNVQNRQNNEKIWHAVDIALTILSFVPVVNVIAGTLRGLRAIIAVVDFVIMASMAWINDYRGEISKTEAGRNFLFFFDLLSTLYIGYAGVNAAKRMAMALADSRIMARFWELIIPAEKSLPPGPGKAQLTEMRGAAELTSREGGAVDNVLKAGDETKNPELFKQQVEGTNLTSASKQLLIEQQKALMTTTEGGAGFKPTGQTITALPPELPNVPKGGGGIVISPQPGPTSNVLFRTATTEVKGVTTTTQEVEIFKPSGEMVQVKRTVVDGAVVESVPWVYSTSGATVPKNAFVMNYLGKEFEVTIKNIQEAEVTTARSTGLWGAEVKTAEGTVGKTQVNTGGVKQTEINTGGTTQTDINTGGTKQTEVNTGGTTQTDINSGGVKTNENAGGVKTNENTGGTTQTDVQTGGAKTEIKSGTTTDVTNTEGGGLKTYKITEPDGITYFSNGRTFKKGTNGKFYEKRGSAWVDLAAEGVTTDAQFEALMNAKLGNFLEATSQSILDIRKSVYKQVNKNGIEFYYKGNRTFKVENGKYYEWSQISKSEGKWNDLKVDQSGFEDILGAKLSVVPDYTSLFGDLRARIMDRLKKTIDPSEITKLDPDAEIVIGYRGSIAKGQKGSHKGDVPFNPTEFDIDAYIGSDNLYDNPVFKDNPPFRDAGRVGLKNYQKELAKKLKEFPEFAGLKGDEVTFRIYRKNKLDKMRAEGDKQRILYEK